MQRLATKLLFSLVFVAFITSAKAELLWSDGCDVMQRMHTLVLKRVPQGCSWAPADSDLKPICKKIKNTGLFGYEEISTRDEPDRVAYEMVVHLEKECFLRLDETLQSAVARKEKIIGVKSAQEVFSKYDADGGPTLIFYFPASSNEIEDVKNVKYDALR